MRFVVSDDYPGMKRGVMETLPEASWQRCYVIRTSWPKPVALLGNGAHAGRACTAKGANG